MRQHAFMLALLFAASGVFAEGWDEIYTARLNNSATYLESKLTLKSAEADYAGYTKPYIPTVSISTGTSGSDDTYESGLVVGSDGATSGTLIPSITFEKLLGGADLSFKAPVNIASTGEVSMGNPALSVSRTLFPETAANQLDAEAALISAQASLQAIKNDIRIELATDVLDTIYYRRLLESSKENLEILEKVRKATVDTTTQRELDKSILEAQKSILTATSALADIKDDVKNNADALYEDITRLQSGWLASINGEEPKSSMTIRSLELSLAAAEKRKSFSILPYLPNPTIAASVYYNVDTSKVDWALSFKLSYDLVNKNENALSALKREEYPKIYSIKLEEAQKGLKDGLRQINDTLESLDLDKKIKDIDLADSDDDMARQEKLYNGGFISEEDYVMAQIDLAILKIEAQKIDFDILIQKLKLAQYYEESQ
ncbi:exported hypothetical protein [uncultured spirochete]|jgi:outer membrane protein TolC|uniref:Outer membrane efflux protein n=1 Tax=uncultured spirochete TaxID=156406 RepID=A0A3P3XS56_9SPIR|nr:exported hypothetical protein [uncultured spirochete]